jgi:Amt family ammonium transporter
LPESFSEYFDIFWLVLCAMLVILMQAGFVCLESGLVRAKNSIHVAGKNLVDFCIASLLFWAFGFGIMFGTSYHGIIGTSFFAFGDTPSAWLYSFFLFQMAFCATTTNIVSGAVAERVKFSGYIALSAILSGLIYPVAGHWAWGGSIPGTESGWLAKMGFIDFAGSTVVHSVGGWMALAALLVIGPRLGRFGPEGREIEGTDLPKAGLGVMLLWIGWFGFTGGSLPQFTGDVPLVIVNTALGGAAGGFMGVLFSWILRKRINVVRVINCVVAGLVSISASAHMLSPMSALDIGALGAAICYGTCELLRRFKIDDVIGAVPAHLMPGIWGTLSVALFSPVASFGTDMTRIEQLKVQILGISAIGAYSFILGYILLRIMDSMFKLRVTPSAERVGLNIAEHGASTSIYNLIQAMEKQRQQADFSTPVEVEPETEAGQIAGQYNMVLEKFNSETERREAAMQVAIDANRTKSRFLANVSHELRTPLNAIMGFAESLTTQIMGPLGHKRYIEYSEHIYKSGQHLLSLINDILDLSKMEEGRYEIKSSPQSLRAAVERAVGFLTFDIKDKKILIHMEIAPDFPKLDADERALTQIITNLLSNAVKFSNKEGDIYIHGWQREDGGISFHIKDTASTFLQKM